MSISATRLGSEVFKFENHSARLGRILHTNSEPPSVFGCFRKVCGKEQAVYKPALVFSLGAS